MTDIPIRPPADAGLVGGSDAFAGPDAPDGSGASGDGQGAVLRFREIDRDFRRVEIEADLGIPAAGIGGLDQQVSASTATVCFAFSAS